MPNFTDYLVETAGIPFSALPFTEVDNLILSQLAYGRMEKAPDALPGRAREVFKNLFPAFSPANERLFTLFCASRRFGSTYITECASVFAAEETKQFAAVTFLLPDGTAYIAFRGTDNTLVGWKEDFYLTFISPIPAQLEALEYINRVGRALGCPLRVGGHSKGGNLAVYAASLADLTVQENIIAVYSNDGPGQDPETIASAGYQRVRGRIHSFVPKASVIGMLLEHESDNIIVNSDARGLYQHNPYSWQVSGTAFERASASFISNYTSVTTRDWIRHLPPDQRKRVIDIVFDLLSAGDVETLHEIRTSSAVAKKILLAAAEMKSEDRKLLFEMLSQFTKIALVNFEKLSMEKITAEKPALERLSAESQKWIDDLKRLEENTSSFISGIRSRLPGLQGGGDKKTD